LTLTNGSKGCDSSKINEILSHQIKKPQQQQQQQQSQLHKDMNALLGLREGQRIGDMVTKPVPLTKKFGVEEVRGLNKRGIY